MGLGYCIVVTEIVCICMLGDGGGGGTIDVCTVQQKWLHRPCLGDFWQLEILCLQVHSSLLICIRRHFHRV